MESFVSTFQDVMMSRVQAEVITLSTEQVSKLRDQYQKPNVGKLKPEQVLEQLILAVPLSLLTQPKPQHLSEAEYLELIMQTYNTIAALRFGLFDKLFPPPVQT